MNVGKERKKGNPDWRPAGEAQAMDLIHYLRKTGQDQIDRGDDAHHEQSSTCKFPFDGTQWPSTMPPLQRAGSTCVIGCAVGLRSREGAAFLGKRWRGESTDKRLLAVLRGNSKCLCGRQHGSSLETDRCWRTAIYPAYLGALGGGCFAKQSFPCPLKAIDVLLFHFVVTGEDGVNPGQLASEQVVQRICTSLFESFAMGFSRALCDPPWVLRAERLGHHAQCAPKR